MKTLLTLLLVIASISFSIQTYAEIAIIVNPKNSSEFNERQIRKLFLGKSKYFEDGTKVKALDTSNSPAIRKQFIKRVLKKSEATYNSYWARMLFSSRGEPPQDMPAEEVIKRVANDQAAIGFIDSSLVTDNVKVVLLVK